MYVEAVSSLREALDDLLALLTGYSAAREDLLQRKNEKTRTTLRECGPSEASWV